jgi:5S rRNA maturation endonuclease (ribonuclease M5)
MFDYLTALNIKGRIRNKTIVLNTLTNQNRVLSQLDKYTKINIFYDNDEAGKSALKELQSLYPVTDCSYLYKDFKDYNELLVQTKNRNTCLTGDCVTVQNLNDGQNYNKKQDKASRG